MQKYNLKEYCLENWRLSVNLQWYFTDLENSDQFVELITHGTRLVVLINYSVKEVGNHI